MDLLGENRNILISFFIAAFAHLLIIISFPQFKTYDNAPKMNNPVLNIKTINPEELQRYRTVGVKKGSKAFSAPVKSMGPSSLRPKNIVEVQKKADERPVSGKLFKGKQLKLAPEEILNQGIEKNNLLKKLPLPLAVAKSLGKSNLNIKFDPPEGVAEDELNSSEKKFYSFTKRSYESYVLSVISSLNNLIKERPHLKNFKNIGEHHLTGRIIFDENGHRRSVKFIQSSKDDNIQLLFERALLNMKVLQNPPKELLDKEKTFTIYYQLTIED